MGTPKPAKQVKQPVQESKTGEILQTSTTVASLVVAIVVLLPTNTSMAKLVIFSIGSFGLPLGVALLLCGFCALTASIWAVDGMRREAGMSVRSLITAKTNLSWLFLALCLFTIIYLGVATAYVR